MLSESNDNFCWAVLCAMTWRTRCELQPAYRGVVCVRGDRRVTDVRGPEIGLVAAQGDVGDWTCSPARNGHTCMTADRTSALCRAAPTGTPKHWPRRAAAGPATGSQRSSPYFVASKPGSHSSLPLQHRCHPLPAPVRRDWAQFFSAAGRADRYRSPCTQAEQGPEQLGTMRVTGDDATVQFDGSSGLHKFL